MNTDKFYAYKIEWPEFMKFAKHGVNALILYYIIKTVEGMQRSTGEWLPIKNEPEWVKINNSLWTKDPSSKSIVISKLQKAKLIKVKKAKTKLSNPIVAIIRDSRNAKHGQRIAKRGTRNGVYEFGHGWAEQENEKKKIKQGKAYGRFVYRKPIWAREKQK